MKNTNFTQGFVEACIGNGLGLPQIKELLRKQACASLFDKTEFTDGFKSVVGECRYNNMSILEKAACVEQLQSQLLSPEPESDK